MPNTYADGTIPWDSFVAPIIPNGSTNPGANIFIFEDFTPDEPSTFTVSNDQTMVPRGGRDTAGVITGSATLQYPTGATTAITPNRFDQFSYPNYRGAAKLFLITKVGIPQKPGQEIKVTINFREVINPAGGGGPIV